MPNFQTVILSLVLAANAAGCQTVPQHYRQFVQTEEIIEMVECELDQAIRSAIARGIPEDFIRAQKAVAVFDLRVVEETDADGRASFAVPITQGKFTLSLGAGRNVKNTRIMEVRVRMFFDDLCLRGTDFSSGFESGLPTGLGLREWLFEVTSVLIESDSNTSYLSYSTEFEVGLDGNLEPGFELVRIFDGTFGGSFKLSKSRTLKQKFSITSEMELPPELAGKRRRKSSNRPTDPDLERATDSFLIRGAIESSNL